MSPFDFDTTDSDLSVGIEIEYPICERPDKYLMARGESSNRLRHSMDGSPRNAYVTYDATVGTEIVSETIPIYDAPQWYAETIYSIEEEYNEKYEPVGLMQDGHTAGTHIHVSQLTTEQAQELYEISQTTWAKVLFCSSIANEDDTRSWPVFRGGRFCQMNFGSDHYDVVNSCSGPGHYEWRLPEPMLPDHMEIVARFLALFDYDPDVAREYAQEILNDADDRITAIRRAEETGMDIDEEPTVRESPAHPDTAGFYETVSGTWLYPEIYTVETSRGTFYMLESEMVGELEIERAPNSPTVPVNGVLYGDTLEPVGDDLLRDDVRRMVRNQNDSEPRETEATEELKKIVKKKKGKLDEE